MPRVELFDRNKVMMKAINLFWNKGYETTSLSDLTQELGIGKGSFYNTFGSKRELFDSCLTMYREGGYATLDQLLKDQKDPISGIRKFLDFHTETMLNDSESRGCLIANSSAELAHDKEIQHFLLEHNQMMKSMIMNFLANTGLDENTEAIADALLIHVTGISVISKFIKDPKRFNASNQQFLKSLKN